MQVVNVEEANSSERDTEHKTKKKKNVSDINGSQGKAVHEGTVFVDDGSISDSSITLQAAQEVGEIHLVDYFSVVTMLLGSKSYAAGQPFHFPFKWRRIGEEK